MLLQSFLHIKLALFNFLSILVIESSVLLLLCSTKDHKHKQGSSSDGSLLSHSRQPCGYRRVLLHLGRLRAKRVVADREQRVCGLAIALAPKDVQGFRHPPPAPSPSQTRLLHHQTGWEKRHTTEMDTFDGGDCS